MTSREPSRLRSSRDVSRVLRYGERRAGRLLVVHRAPVDDDGVRLGFVASRRVGSAVQRNRAKRLLREAARRVDWQGRQDVVLVARAGCATASLEEVTRELHRLVEDLRAAA